MERISLYGDKPGEKGDVVNLGSLTPRYNFRDQFNCILQKFRSRYFCPGSGQENHFQGRGLCHAMERLVETATGILLWQDLE